MSSDKKKNERELLEVIGPQIERRQFRRQLRNFIILVAAVLALGLGAHALWTP